MNQKLTLFILILIIGVGFILRFHKLGQVPAGLYLDEAAQGYNAYSILKTGKDEFGKSYPFVFRSFADFKTPVYIYLIVPLIPIFDLTAFTVRFPSFLFSVLTFPLLYLLIRHLTSKENYFLPLTATLLLTISPWHILFGRTNFECNVALFFLLFGIYLFYLGLKNQKYFALSALFAGISLSAYHTERVITPLIFIALVIRHRRQIFTKPKKIYLLLSTIIGLITVLPTIMIMTTPGFAARINTLNIFSSIRTPYDFLSNIPQNLNFFLNNRLLLNLQEFFSLYFSYFSPRNMFYLGDYGPRSSFPELATFYPWQLPFYLIGLYGLFKNQKYKELRFLTILLLLVSPIPASLTIDPYSTIRSLPLVIPQIIIISLGITTIIPYRGFHKPLAFKVEDERSIKDISSLARNLKTKIIASTGFIIVLFFSIIHFYSSAFILNEYYRAKDWDYGWQQLVEVLNRLDPKLPIVIDNARGEGYSQIAFYLKADPIKYQTENFEVSEDEYYSKMKRQTTKKIDQITLRGIDWIPDTSIKQYLIGDYLAISPEQIKANNLHLIAEIKYPDNSPAFVVVKTNPK